MSGGDAPSPSAMERAGVRPFHPPPIIVRPARLPNSIAIMSCLVTRSHWPEAGER